MEGITGRRVFVVEEEALLRMLLTEMLNELGCEAASETGNLAQAMRLARDADFDVALLDVMVSGALVYPVADIVRGRGLPVVLATGLEAGSLPEQYRNCPFLQKPYDAQDVARALAAALNG